MSGVVVALATFPDMETARTISRTLVEEHLAACVNLLPGAQSIYRWEGQIVEETEIVAIFKTTTIHRGKFQQRLIELHPAQVAECIFLDVLDGSPAYLNWVRSEVVFGNWRKPLES
ncbi:MAG: divalent-cation tolerance protein CutA [Chthoniobacterales bacterium]